MDTIVFTHFEILSNSGQPFSLNIPYFCQRCGLCCSETSFPGSKEEIRTIFKTVKSRNKNAECEMQKKPCIFLINNLCQFYEHRPLLCREWFPRLRSKCLAFQLHQKMGKKILKNKPYRIGVRKVLFLEKPNPINPTIYELDFIHNNLLGEYNFPSRELALNILEIIDNFGLTQQELEIFKGLNPIYKFIDQTSLFFKAPIKTLL